MIKIMFICHGNICRSPMAEFVFRDMVLKKGLEDMFYIASSATSTEEIGNPVHHGTRNKLKEVGIDTTGKRAIQLKKEDYNKYDYLIGMEQKNITNTMRIISKDENKKVKRLLDFTSNPSDIDDPWYTGNFNKTYEDVYKGCLSLLNYILKTNLEM
jgi:protein-tyrosine phosphatase